MRTKRAQRRRQRAAVAAPEPKGLPDPFGEAWPNLVALEAYLADACPCCEGRLNDIYDALERELEQDWGGDDWVEWQRCQEDERERPWQHLIDEVNALYERVPDSQRYLDWPNYDDWRRAFPNLQWDTA